MHPSSRRDRTYAPFLLGAATSCLRGPRPNSGVACVVVQPATVALNTIGATSQLAAEARTIRTGGVDVVPNG